MTPKYFPGASYRVELVTGEFVQLFDGELHPPKGWLETHLGRIDLPPGEAFGVIELDCTNVGGFRFAGLSHAIPPPGRIWRWSPEFGWTFLNGPLASPVRYDVRGVLHWWPIPLPNNEWSSQGYRYADAARVYTGDETFAIAELRVWEYVRIADLIIGQADEGIVVVGPDKVRRLLEPGHCIRIQARTDGHRAVVSAWKSLEHCCVTYRGTLDEFRALPAIVSGPAPSPVPVPQPKPEPTPVPTFAPIQLPAQAQGIVNALYQRHQDLARGDDDARRSLTKMIAETVRFALGASWGWKRAGGPPSKDAIAYRGGDGFLHGFDLFSGATREPFDRPMSVDITAQTFIEVEPVNHLGVEEPKEDPKEPQQPPVDLGPVLNKLAQLEEKVEILTANARLGAKEVERLSAENVELRRRLAFEYAKYGDPVEVSGRVSLFGTSRWGGTIVKK